MLVTLRQSDSKNGFPCNFSCQVMIKLIGELKVMSSGGIFWIVVHISTGVSANIAENFDVFIELFLSIREIE